MKKIFALVLAVVILLSLLQGVQIEAQIRHPEGRQARLPGAEEVAGAPEF